MYKIITDLLQLDEFWREGILYVSATDPGQPLEYNLDISPGPVSADLEGAVLLPSGMWRRVCETHNTFAIRLED